MIYPPQPSQISTRSRQFREIENDPSWVAEPCVRGMRCLAYHHHGQLDLLTQEWKQITALFPKLRKQIFATIPDGTIVDGVLCGAGKQYDHYFAFDIPQFKNKQTGPLHERIALLRLLLKKQSLIIVPAYYPNQNKLVTFYGTQNLPEYNGIILKDLSSMYPVVTKWKSITSSWLKVTT